MDPLPESKVDAKPEDTFEASLIPSIKLSPDGRILKINSAALLMYGWEKEYVVGKDYVSSCHQLNIKALIREYIHRVSQEAHSASGQKFSSKRLLEDSDQYILTPTTDVQGRVDGVLVEVSKGRVIGQIAPSQKSTSVESQTGGAAQKQSTIQLLVNITEIKKPEQVQRILDNPEIASDAIVIIDGDYKIRGATKSFVKLTGQALEKVSGHTFNDKEEPLPLLHEALVNLLSGKESKGRSEVYEGKFNFDLNLCKNLNGSKYVIGFMTVEQQSYPLASNVLSPPSQQGGFDFIREIPPYSKQVAGKPTKVGSDQFRMDGMVFTLSDFNSYDIRRMLRVMQAQYNTSAFENHLHEIGFFVDMSTNPISLFWTSTQLIHLGCNRRALQITECQFLDELVGNDDIQVAQRNDWPPKIAEVWQQFDKEVLEKRKIISNIEEKMVNGQVGYKILTVKGPLQGLKGGLKGVIGVSKID